MATNFESNFFTLLELLDPGSRLEVEAVCTKSSVQPNEVIYQQGDPSNLVYIVISGRVEAFTQSPDGRQTRSIGFMGKGEFFGELGILTGEDRMASMRSCEPTKLFQIEKMAFLRLLEKVPKLGAYFAKNVARRLYHTSTEAFVDVYSVDLAGNLQHFNLLTLFQAITNRGLTGQLHLNNASNELIGSFFFRKGRAEHARFVHLVGVEAVWQGFVESATVGTFIFRVKDEPSAPPFSDENRIKLESTDLLMQGVTRRDAFHAIPESLREMHGRLSRVTEELVWTDAETQGLAERVWELIAKRPQPLESLWRRLNYSAHTYLEVVIHLVNTGQAELLAEEPAGEKPA